MTCIDKDQFRRFHSLADYDEIVPGPIKVAENDCSNPERYYLARWQDLRCRRPAGCRAHLPHGQPLAPQQPHLSVDSAHHQNFGCG
ncbi:hypothetical protein ACQP2P_21660 [Dactylosporangium sp. CA-139114]|uniref:hypothetical protein n=1 Tax=Dactylosporangium sp. CA-139114 TaxID=3239931 RepID=UPI003D98A2F9